MASRSWLLRPGDKSAPRLTKPYNLANSMHSILLGVEGGLFARREALRDVVFTYALRVVCGGHGKSNLVYARTEEIINLEMFCGRAFGADRRKESAPFCVAHKAEAKLGYFTQPRFVFLPRRGKSPSRRGAMLFYDLVFLVYLHDFWFEISRFFGAKKRVSYDDDDVADADFARGRAV